MINTSIRRSNSRSQIPKDLYTNCRTNEKLTINDRGSAGELAVQHHIFVLLKIELKYDGSQEQKFEN